MHFRFQSTVVHFNSWSPTKEQCCTTLVWPHTLSCFWNYLTLHCIALLLCISVPKNSLHAQCISTPCFDQVPHPLNALCVTYSNSTSPGLPKKSEPMHPNAIQCSVLLLSTRFTPPPHVFRLSSSSSSEAAVWYGQKYGPYYPIVYGYYPIGSRQIGPRQIGPRQIGPLADLAANWAPHFLGPNLPFFGKSGPGRLGPLAADWAPANWAPADWAPCRQIGPRQIGPRQIGPLGGKLGPSKSSPGKLGPCFIFICIGYILPTIGKIYVS